MVYAIAYNTLNERVAYIFPSGNIYSVEIVKHGNNGDEILDTIKDIPFNAAISLLKEEGAVKLKIIYRSIYFSIGVYLWK